MAIRQTSRLTIRTRTTRLATRQISSILKAVTRTARIVVDAATTTMVLIAVCLEASPQAAEVAERHPRSSPIYRGHQRLAREAADLLLKHLVQTLLRPQHQLKHHL